MSIRVIIERLISLSRPRDADRFRIKSSQGQGLGPDKFPSQADEDQGPDPMVDMCDETSRRLRAADGDRAAIVAAIERFLDFGDAGEYSPAVLWNYFATSSPTVPEMAGCDAAGEDKIIRIFSTCTDARYGDGLPLPDDWPWHEEHLTMRGEGGRGAYLAPGSFPRCATRIHRS